MTAFGVFEKTGGGEEGGGWNIGGVTQSLTLEFGRELWGFLPPVFLWVLYLHCVPKFVSKVIHVFSQL